MAMVIMEFKFKFGLAEAVAMIWVGHIGRVLKGYGPRRQSCEPRDDQNEFDDIPDEDVFTFQPKPPSHFHKRQVCIRPSLALMQAR